jgi:hypothetical protein
LITFNASDGRGSAVLGAVVVDGDLDVVLDGELLDDRQRLGRRPDVHHRQPQPFGVFKIRLHVVGVVLLHVDGASAGQDDAGALEFGLGAVEFLGRRPVEGVELLDCQQRRQLLGHVDACPAAELAVTVAGDAQADGT